MKKASINLGSPVNWASPLNQGLISWWLPLPNNSGGGTLFDLCRRNNGTLTNMDPATDWVPGSTAGFGALDFDGSDDHVMIPTNSSLQPTLPVSVSLWAFATSLASAVIPFALGKNSTTHSGVWLSLGTDGNFSAHYGTNGGTGSSARRSFAAPAGTAVTNTWYHLGAVIRGATDGSLYVNGLPASVATSGSGASLNYGGKDTYIGGAALDSPLSGRVADVRVYNRGLSDGAFWQLYRDSLTGYRETLRRCIPLPIAQAAAAPAGGTNHHFLPLLGAA